MKAKKSKRWIRLDNAAKIFPPTCDKRDPKVFRFSCELTEVVKPDILQKALDKTMEAFPGYLSVMKHGFFWYYLESTDLRPVVHEDNSQICGPLYDKNEHGLLFDVSYYKRRINIEMFHVLADGTGALEFMRALVCRYLGYVHEGNLGDSPPSSGYDASDSEKMADSFQKYYNPKNKKKESVSLAYKVKGSRLSENRLKVIEGIMPVDKMLQLARAHGTTMTIFLTSVLICAIYDSMPVRFRKRPISISVPVNLRKYFESESSRNFFSVIYITHNFNGQPADIKEVIKAVSERFKQNLTQESIEQNMNALVAMEKNYAIRAVPLIIKDFAMRMAYNINDLSVTAALSNVGQIELPAVYAPYIRLFDVMTSTKKIQICMCSHKNNLVITFTDSFVSSDIQKYFFRMLSSFDIPVEIVTNPLDERRP